MIHFGAIQIKVGRILRMHAALIEGIGGPSRTEAEHPQPRFDLNMSIEKCASTFNYRPPRIELEKTEDLECPLAHYHLSRLSMSRE